MTDIDDTTTTPLHHWTGSDGTRYRWGGSLTCLCTRCGELFTSVQAFDKHHEVRGTETICLDPESIMKKDGEPYFAKVDKPSWNPPYVWLRNSNPASGSAPPWLK